MMTVPGAAYNRFIARNEVKTKKSKKTILFVDDEPDNLKSFGEIFTDAGYDVILKPDGRAALAVFREGADVDIAITDFRMPVMDGLEFITELRNVAPALPVIMLTAFGGIETYLKSRCLGVFEYVSKPVRPEELLRIVKAALDASITN